MCPSKPVSAAWEVALSSHHAMVLGVWATNNTVFAGGISPLTCVRHSPRLGLVHASQRCDMSISVRRNLAWMVFSQVGLVVIQFGGSVAVARLLTPREMGIYAVAAAVVGILNLIRSFGLSSLIIREPELTRSAAATIFTINAVLNVACAVFILTVSEIGSRVLGDAGVGKVMHLLAITPLFNIFEFLPSARLEREGAFRVIALINIGRTIVNIGVTVLLAASGFSYMSIAWGATATALFGVIYSNAAAWRYVSLRLGLQDWRRIARFGLQMLTVSAVSGITSRLTDLLIGRLISLSALGLYSRAAGLNGLLWDNLHLIVARVVFVDFAEQHRRGLSLRESYLRIVSMLTGFLWPAFLGLAILARPIVLTIYGENWIESALPLSLMSIAGILYVGITMTHELYTVSGEMSRQVKVELKRNILGSFLFVVGCLGGLAWAAASRIGDAAITILLVKKDLERITQTRPSDFIPIYVQSGGLTILACGPAALLMAANGWSEYTSVTAILGAAAGGCCAWTVGLWYVRHPLYLELATVGHRMRQAFVSRT